MKFQAWPQSLIQLTELMFKPNDMKKNQLIALVIISITILGPLQFSLRPDVLEATAIRAGLMLLTLLGTLAALFIGISNPAKA